MSAKREPRAWLRKWHADGETPAKERNENGRMAWPFKFKLMPVTPGRCLVDDIPLYELTPAEKAAPDLLEALEWLVALLPDPELDTDEVQRQYGIKARAAIAKATGE